MNDERAVQWCMYVEGKIMINCIDHDNISKMNTDNVWSLVGKMKSKRAVNLTDYLLKVKCHQKLSLTDQSLLSLIILTNVYDSSGVLTPFPSNRYSLTLLSQ